MITSNEIEIYTDGACRGNPGAGGWGAIIFTSGEEKHISGFETKTTNNRMELQAAISALEALKGESKTIVLFTDSEYLRKGMTQWLKSWKSRNWKTAARKPVKNVDLWMKLDELDQQHSITWRWVKAHDGNLHNERVDALANKAIDEAVY